MRFLVMLLLAASVVFADVGPAPDPPKVVVHMVKDGQPETSIESITYKCVIPYGGGAMMNEPRPVEFHCDGGTCTNDGSDWFYKFDPCFSFPRGEFTYSYNGKQMVSERFEFSDSFDKYELTIDAPSGHIDSKLGSSLPGCCGSGFMIGAILAGMAFVRKR